jgi:hypothetical protein
VSETWIIPIEAGASVTVALPREHHDGLSGVQPSPGAAVDPGASPSVTWTPPASASGPQTFSVSYVASRAFALGPGRARLAWPILPRGHGWRIREASVAITTPPGVTPVSPAGVAEPGWEVAERPDGLEARKAGVAPGETATLILEFSRDDLSPPEPAWQFLSQRAEEFKPAFASAAAFILVVGLAVLGMLRVFVPDQARAQAARGLRVSGLVFLVLGPLLAVLVRLTLHTFGPWAQSVPAAIAAVGLLFLAAGLLPLRHR